MLSYLATETIFTGNRTQDSFFWGGGILAFVSVIPSSKKKLSSWLRSSIVLSFSELQKTPSPGFKLRTPFHEFWPTYVLFLVSRNKHAKFGANQFNLLEL
jgi:hypothetical protein